MKRLSKSLLLILVAASITGSLLPGSKTILTETTAAVFQDQPRPQLQLSCRIPNDAILPEADKGNPTALQQDFDIYSWNIFIALNWPAINRPKGIGPCTLQNGVANCQVKIGQAGTKDAPTVWETFKSSYEIFRADNNGNPIAPTPWTCPPTLPEGCSTLRGQNAGNVKVINMISKDAVNEFTEAFSGPLIDQNGNYARYEIRVNYDEFKYIVDRKLYDSRNQVDVRFPAGSTAPGGGQGAIEVKAAWKVMGPGDDPRRFHTRWTVIAWFDQTTGKYKCSGKPVLMGLVGLHIMHKTVNAPQWIWSTFEQVDNYMPREGAPLGSKASFRNPDCPPQTCPPNQQPAKPWDPNPTVKHSPPTQVVPPDWIRPQQQQQALNQQAWALLKTVNPNTVWQYYRLVSTQWPQNPGTVEKPEIVCPTPSLGTQGALQTPVNLANPVLETYIEPPGFPQCFSSCMYCHSLASTTINGTKQQLDFSFMLGDAYPQSKTLDLKTSLKAVLAQPCPSPPQCK